MLPLLNRRRLSSSDGKGHQTPIGSYFRSSTRALGFVLPMLRTAFSVTAGRCLASFCVCNLCSFVVYVLVAPRPLSGQDPHTWMLDYPLVCSVIQTRLGLVIKCHLHYRSVIPLARPRPPKTVLRRLSRHPNHLLLPSFDCAPLSLRRVGLPTSCDILSLTSLMHSAIPIERH